jgi:hypothetical protein
MSHIETGRTAIPEAKLRALAAAYGCKDKPLIDALVTMGRATGKGWWMEYRDVLQQSALDLAELEATATVHRTFQWIYVHGLLQTPEYMRALFEAADPEAPSEVVDTFIEFRVRRQKILTRDAPLTFYAVIHEAALHMQFVGADVMRRQIRHLVEMARLPNVRIQILPFKAQLYPARFGTPFVIFESPVPELSTVYVEHPITSRFLGDQKHLAQFTEAFDKLSTVALPALEPAADSKGLGGKDSLSLVQHLLYIL